VKAAQLNIGPSTDVVTSSATPGLKTLPSPGVFVIDPVQRNIDISGLVFSIAASQGSIQYSIEYDQYNATHAIGSPNNAALYMDLLDINGHTIPGPQIIEYPEHDFCHHRHVIRSQNHAEGYPEDLDLLNAIVAVALRCGLITYDVDVC
jgi:hypothetical protein